MEGTVAEQSDGSLFIAYRLQGDGAAAGTARQHALSTDGGQTLRRRFTRSSLPIVTVQGSALALPSGQLLFSAPADRTPTLRRDMTVFSSSTRGSTWNRGYQVELESTPGSYSDLVLLDARTVGILYETGTSTWKERIRFRRLAIAQAHEADEGPVHHQGQPLHPADPGDVACPREGDRHRPRHPLPARPRHGDGEARLRHPDDVGATDVQQPRPAGAHPAPAAGREPGGCRCGTAAPVASPPRPGRQAP
ncbi:hypothetical protein GCM10025868_22980 [Angustibacter aerolatus]|uniref:exo-alpha-sialidase n=1 Tax=Angustibacter aerolatus TaxID=1162965 RepID=A0ABQ6JI33_9ACTN|nr:hypothetical protein GCM10025868_22980 [Angustibacter aerolatus]